MSFNGFRKLAPPGYQWVKVDPEIYTDGPDCYPWKSTYALWPVRTITGKYVCWQKIYKRRVWKLFKPTHFSEPVTQYATMFEILVNDDSAAN